jgi:hypothetical protein
MVLRLCRWRIKESMQDAARHLVIHATAKGTNRMEREADAPIGTGEARGTRQKENVGAIDAHLMPARLRTRESTRRQKCTAQSHKWLLSIFVCHGLCPCLRTLLPRASLHPIQPFKIETIAFGDASV